MRKQIEENYLFEFEKDNRDRENKEFYIFNDGCLFTIKFVINQKKLQELKNFLKKNYTYKIIETRKNVILNVNDKDETFDDDGYINQIIISNRHVETRKEKIGLLKTKEVVTNYGDITKIFDIKPTILSILDCIELKKYLNLVNLHNYIIACKKMDPNLKIYTYEGSNRTILSKFTDLHFNPNNHELGLTNEEILNIIERIFNCFEIKKIERLPIINNQINVNANATYDELINLKSKLTLAELNSRVVSKNILENSFQEIIKILQKKCS